MYSLILALGTPTTASDGAAAGGSMVTTLITFGVIILIFYFLIIRPQRKRDKEAKAMLEAIKKGDKVVTIGGIRGTVAVVKDSTVVLKVDDNTRIEFSKSAISQVLNKKEEPAAEKPAKKEKGEKPAVEAPKAEAAKEEKAEESKAEEAAPAEEKA